PTDPAGVYVARAMARESAASVVFDGTNYFVVFQAAETSGSGSGRDNDIRAVRVDTNGNVLDANGGRVLYSGPGNQAAPAVTGTGTQFLVVWADTRNGDFDVYGTRVSAAYNVLDPTGIPIATGAGDQTFPSLDYNTTAMQFLVAWQDHSGADFDIRA